jgi:hypothetical protein
VVVQCENGSIVSTSEYDRVQAFGPDGEEIKTFHGGGDHFANFLEAVRSRKTSDLNASAIEGHYSSALCHTGGISHQLGEPRTADEIMAAVGDIQPLRDSLERMLAHLRANEVNIDKPVITAGADLQMNPTTEQFTNNPAANEMLRREDRKPYVVPEIA